MVPVLRELKIERKDTNQSMWALISQIAVKPGSLEAHRYTKSRLEIG
jgi:hypothetical protein